MKIVDYVGRIDFVVNCRLLFAVPVTYHNLTISYHWALFSYSFPLTVTDLFNLLVPFVN